MSFCLLAACELERMNAPALEVDFLSTEPPEKLTCIVIYLLFLSFFLSLILFPSLLSPFSFPTSLSCLKIFICGCGIV